MDLNSYIEANTNFVQFKNDNDCHELYYMGYAIIPDKFRIKEDPEKNKGATTVSYKFKTRKGHPQEWTQGSTKVAANMGKFAVGDLLSITKVKKGEYFIHKLASAGIPQPEANGTAPVLDEQTPF